MGVSGHTFAAFKFRTTIVNAERRRRREPISFAEQRLKFKSPQDPRAMHAGHWLRKTSLDELPQLLNSVSRRGEPGGPRMIAPDEQARYGKRQHNLLTVKRGIRGRWQVQGRGDIANDERVGLSTQPANARSNRRARVERSRRASRRTSCQRATGNLVPLQQILWAQHRRKQFESLTIRRRPVIAHQQLPEPIGFGLNKWTGDE